MVSIFGMKFFESPSMEEQMHYKGRSSSRKHRSRRHRRHHFKSRRHFKGGYVYDKKSGDNEEDVTMELSNSQKSSSRVGKGTKRHRKRTN